MGGWAGRRKAELKLGLRVTLAGVASFALAQSLALPEGYWAVFTAVIVVQASVGGSLKAVFDRLAGTLGGAAFGAAVLTVIPHDSSLAMGIALAAALAPLAVLAAIYPSFRVAPVTASILLVGGMGPADPVTAAFFRSVEVVLGSVVGLAVSVLVLPARARNLVGEQAGRLLSLLANFLSDRLHILTGAEPLTSAGPQHDAIQLAFDRLEAAAGEAKRERTALLAQNADADPVPRTLRRIFHDIVLVGRVAAQPLPDAVAASLKPALGELDSAVSEFLRASGTALTRVSQPPSPERVNSAVLRTLAELAALERTVQEHAVAGRLVALGFALEQLQRNMSDLAARVAEFTRAKPSG